MAIVCDRSPCDPLLNALGNAIFCSGEDGYYCVYSVDGKDVEESIHYCPYCGMRLDQVPAIVIEKFTRPRRRRRRQTAAS